MSNFETVGAEIASLKERIKALLLGNKKAEDAEAQADADQARAMALLRACERECDDFYRKR